MMVKWWVRVVLVALVLGLTACGRSSHSLPEQVGEVRESAVAAGVKLEAADRLVLKKAVMTVGDEWTITVGDEHVADAVGLDLPVVGDVYALVSPEGGVVASEEEDIFHLAPTARVFDGSGVQYATLRKELLSLLARYELVAESDGRVLASVEQKFDLAFSGEVVAPDGSVAWRFRKDLVSVGARVEVERVGGGVSAQDALLMVLVAHEVDAGEGGK